LLRQEPPVLAVLLPPPPPERRDDGGEPLMSGCACHGSAACFDLNMLGQCLLLKDAAMATDRAALLDQICLKASSRHDGGRECVLGGG
jgi:hypothetical protein